MDEANGLLPDDKLTIFCEVSTFCVVHLDHLFDQYVWILHPLVQLEIHALLSNANFLEVTKSSCHKQIAVIG